MRKHFPLVAFVAVAIVSLAMAAFAYVAAQDASRIKFEAMADDARNRIESRVELHVSLLRATHAFFAAHGGAVTREQFRTFFSTLDVEKNFSGLRGLGVLALGRRGDDAALEQAIARIHGAGRKVFPDSPEEWRTAVMLYEPLDTATLTGIGLDMYSDPARREAIVGAWESGEPRASARVILGQQTDGPNFPGVLVFMRFGGGAERPLAGNVPALLFATFRAQDLFTAALDRLPVLPVHVRVYDGDPSPANLLYESGSAEVEPFGENLVVSRPISVAGRLWTIEFRPTSGFLAPTSRTVPVMLGLFGLLLAGAIALVARYQDRAYDAVSRMRETSEKSLLEKDLMLQEMKHRIKNSITRVLAIARQTAASAKDIGEFSASFASRLQAMAASQDMLTRSSWQKADLGELLQTELAQVFGKELPEDVLAGPEVLLSEAMTQALGLTFHELATNALKYGEAGNSPGALKVTWRIERAQSGARLVLAWRETGKPATEPLKSGFGTKLIDMNIVRELGGTIERDWRDDGLEVRIVIPLERQVS